MFYHDTQLMKTFGHTLGDGPAGLQVIVGLSQPVPIIMKLLPSVALCTAARHIPGAHSDKLNIFSIFTETKESK